MEKKNRGEALIIVMCVMLIVVAFSLALLRSAALLVQNQVRDSQREQCRINAVSVSEVVTEEIESFLYSGTEEADLPQNQDANLKDQLAMASAGAWEDGRRIRYQLQGEQLPGKTWIEFYVSGDERPEEVLYMEVSSMVGKETCTVINRFVPVYYEDDMGDDDENDGDGEDKSAGNAAEVGDVYEDDAQSDGVEGDIAGDDAERGDMGEDNAAGDDRKSNDTESNGMESNDAESNDMESNNAESNDTKDGRDDGGDAAEDDIKNEIKNDMEDEWIRDSDLISEENGEPEGIWWRWKLSGRSWGEEGH